VLRVLGNLLQLAGFDYVSSEDVRAEALGSGDLAARLDNRLASLALDALAPAAGSGLQRIGEVPIYAADAIVRRAPSLQKTRDAAPPVATMHRATADLLGLREGDEVRLAQESGEAVAPYAIDDRLPQGCIRFAAARPESATLGAMFGTIEATRVAGAVKVAV
jgi:NADH-quinone oxidoreductase subunit G